MCIRDRGHPRPVHARGAAQRPLGPAPGGAVAVPVHAGDAALPRPDRVALPGALRLLAPPAGASGGGAPGRGRPLARLARAFTDHAHFVERRPRRPVLRGGPPPPSFAPVSYTHLTL